MKTLVEENLRAFLKKFCPNFYDIIKDKKSIWRDVSAKFDKKLTLSESKIAKDGSILTENSIPVLLGKAEENDKISIDFLAFIDSEIKFLYDSADINLKSSVVKLIERLFLEFDIKELSKPNPTYLNGLSEILTINKLIKTGDYKLKTIEFSLPNNKTADFVLSKTATDNSQYIEVYNIHVDENKVSDFDNFKRFVDKRITEKHSTKTNALENDLKSVFFLFPVIWADISINKHLMKYLDNFDLSYLNVLPPCSLMQFNDGENKIFHFGINDKDML